MNLEAVKHALKISNQITDMVHKNRIIESGHKQNSLILVPSLTDTIFSRKIEFFYNNTLIYFSSNIILKRTTFSFFLIVKNMK